jgi:hypothetical protein
MVVTIKHTKDPMYFINNLSIIKKEYIIIKFYNNNKIKLVSSEDNIKIKINKIINKSSLKGKYILYSLGYNIDNYDKLILECTFLIKSRFINKKINDILIIIINYNGSMVLYKYIIYKNNKYVYNGTLIEDI